MSLIPRPHSSLANNPVNPEKHENPDLIEKGLNLLLSISDRVEEMKVERFVINWLAKTLFFHSWKGEVDNESLYPKWNRQKISSDSQKIQEGKVPLG